MAGNSSPSDKPFVDFFYRGEYVDECDNPWDGRTVYGNCTTLEGAKAAIHKTFGTHEDSDWHAYDYPQNMGGSVVAAWYYSHEGNEEATLWIFKEGITE